MKKVKVINFAKKLKTNISPLWFILVLITIVLSFFHWAFIIIGLLAFLLGIRLYCGKIYPRPGEIILFWGLPGSGKTNFLNKVAFENKKKGAVIAGNEEFHSSSDLSDFEFKKSYWGFFDPGEVIHFVDEASLNGWDNRDWSINFVPESLEEWKKIRHRNCAAVLSNQGFEELDCKIRDSLTSTVYYVENKGSYSTATRMSKCVYWDEMGKPLEGYEIPSFFDRLLDPTSVLYARHKKWGQFYRTRNPRPLPSLDMLSFYDELKDKKGRTVAWIFNPEKEVSDNGQ